MSIRKTGTTPASETEFLKYELWREQGYCRDVYTVDVTADMQIGAVVKDDGDGTYSQLADADIGIKITPTVQNSSDYTIGLNVGNTIKTFTFTSDADATATEIVDGLVSLINGDADVNTSVTASNDSDVLVLIEDNSTDVFVISTSDNLSVEDTVKSIAIVSDNAIYDDDSTGDREVAVIHQGPAVIAKEGLRYADAITSGNEHAIYNRLRQKGIKVGSRYTV